MFPDSFPSPLITGDPSMQHHISSLFDTGLVLQLHNCGEEIVSANSICVNNCKLSCRMLPVVFDVLDVIKSVFAVNSARVKACWLVSCLEMSVSCWHGFLSQLIRRIAIFLILSARLLAVP